MSIAYPATFLERGERFRIHLTDYTFMVPLGMDLVMGRGMAYSDGSIAVNLWDWPSGSFMIIDIDSGSDRGRGPTRSEGDGGERSSDAGAQSATGDGGRDVGTPFRPDSLVHDEGAAAMMLSLRRHAIGRPKPRTLAFASMLSPACMCVVIWASCSADLPPSGAPVSSPPPNPTTLSGITVSHTALMLVEGESKAIVLSLDSSPGEAIEMRVRWGKADLGDVAFTPDAVAWTATAWDQPEPLTITALADDTAERLESHELQVWTYRRGQIGPGQQILRKETIRVWISDPRELRAFSGGVESPDVV